MAKNKPILTPEELEAKNARKAEKRKIFGETFFKALAVMLSVVLVYSIVYIAFGQGTVIEQRIVGTVGSSSTGGSTSGGSTSGGSTSSGSTSSDAGSTSGSAAASSDAAEFATLLNSATKAAVDGKAGYDWSRKCTVTDIDVGSMTGALNKIIQGIDENSDLNSVVGGFLGAGDQKYTVPKGQTLDTIDVTKSDGTTEKLYHGSNYTLKATTLKAEDVQNLKVNGDTYEFELPACSNPDRSGNNAVSRFTNDVILQTEVESEIKQFISAVSIKSMEANYTKVAVKAVITDGKLMSLQYDITGNAKLSLSIGISVTGTGNLASTTSYTNFVY